MILKTIIRTNKKKRNANNYLNFKFFSAQSYGFVPGAGPNKDKFKLVSELVFQI